VPAPESHQIRWLWPWVATIFGSSIGLFVTGALAVLEGCQRTLDVARIRLWQALVANALFWLALLANLELWATAVLLGTSALVAITLIWVKHRRLLTDLMRPVAVSEDGWRKDLFAMQWPLAIQGIAGFFLFSYFVPAVFKTSGAVEAGQLGMALQIVYAIISVASVPVSVRLPALAVDVARGDRMSLESRWGRATLVSVGVYCLGGMVLFAGAGVLTAQRAELAMRLLPLVPLLYLFLWGLLALLTQCLATYWRAHKAEPLGAWSVLPGLAALAAISIGAARDGANGAVLGALLSYVVVTLPLAIWGWRLARSRFERNAS
jgi:O-antigen/teichoic acid export membrane protein